jgi:hypothetical protein
MMQAQHLEFNQVLEQEEKRVATFDNTSDNL